MGREIRRVPPNWQHPKKQEANHLLGRMEEVYQPMRDESAEDAWKEWQTEFAAWLTGEGAASAEPYREFCESWSSPPDPDYCRPHWDEAAATWYQVYETVSEGTPVTPPFATREELIEYLTAYGDFWDQKRRREGRVSPNDCGPWERAAAEKFVAAGSAFSMIVTATGQVKMPRDGGI